MQFLTVILLSLSIITETLAQQADLKLLHTIDVTASDLRIDQLNQVYLRTSAYELTKFSVDGQQIANFSDVQYGPISFVDPGNPLNLLLYYRPQQNVVILDVSLSVLRSFNLSRLGYVDVPVVANSQDNLFWIFDNTDGRLKKLDNKGNVVYSSVNLASEYDIRSPAFILARHNFVFLSDTGRGIFVFDNFGQFYRKFPITGVEKFQYANNQLIYYDEQQLQAVDMKTMKRFSLPVPGENVKWAAWQKPLLFVHQADAIRIYKVAQ
jgi:hypothetical protein